MTTKTIGDLTDEIEHQMQRVDFLARHVEEVFAAWLLWGMALTFVMGFTVGRLT